MGMLKEGEHSAQISAQPTLAPTQGTGERSSVHHKHVRIECSWKKKGRGSSRNRDEFDSHTQGDYKCQVLQHHIVVQASLSIIKETPFLPGEVHSHILKGHTALARWGQMKS